MIKSLSVKNFLSFNDTQEISFEAGNKKHDKNLAEKHFVTMKDGTKLQKLNIIYGANGSGKTNLLYAFNFVRKFWNENSNDKNKNIDFISFLMDDDSRKQPTEFVLEFYFEDKKYKYQLEIFENKVLKESLDYYPSHQPANLFSRKYEDGLSVIEFGNKIKVDKIEKKEIELKCLQNISFFVALKQVNVKIEILSEVLNWFKKNELFRIVLPSGSENMFPHGLRFFTEHLIFEEKKFLPKIVKYLQKADINIENINITEEKKTEEMIDILENFSKIGIIPDQIKNVFNHLKNLKNEFIHTVTINGEKKNYPLDFNLQSDGTKRLFGLSGIILKAIENNSFLAIDEIESSLHPHLISYVIEEFLNASEKSQLLLTTHHDNLMEERGELLCEDNFWFTEKNPDGSTELYSMIEFKNLNRISSLQKAYKHGNFGAIPEIK